MDAEGLNLLRSQRLAFLRAVYDSARGRRNAGFSENAIASNLGFDEELAETIAQYLVEEGLLEWFSMGYLAITHRGIVEIEAGIETPDQPTDHFPPVVRAETYIHIGGSMIGSAIQQGTTASTQIVGGPIDTQGAIELMTGIRAALAELALGADSQAEAEAELATIDVQLASPKPKVSILRESVTSLRHITEGAVAGGLAPQLPALLEQLAHAVSSAM
jgi:hypothetical protein